MANNQQLNIDTAFATDAEFRTWVIALQTLWAAIGLIQTADTGQINNTTVLKPSGATTVMGYEIWRFDDAQQATHPIFLKIEYGGGDAATDPGIWITVGSSTDGAGNVKNICLNRQQVEPLTSGQALTDYKACLSRSALIFSAAPPSVSQAQYIFMFSLERLVDDTGAFNGLLGFLFITSETSASRIKVLDVVQGTDSGDLNPGSQQYPFINPVNIAVGLRVNGGDTFISPVFFVVGGYYCPSMALVMAHASDMGVAFSSTRRGTAVNYRPLDSVFASGQIQLGGSASLVAFGIWE